MVKAGLKRPAFLYPPSPLKGGYKLCVTLLFKAPNPLKGAENKVPFRGFRGKPTEKHRVAQRIRKWFDRLCQTKIWLLRTI
jgi:hypothetical protein